MSSGDPMESSQQPPTPSEVMPDLQDSILKILAGEPHRPYTAEDLVKILKPQVAKDPQKQPQALAEMTADLGRLVEAGYVVETEPGRFKARIFFDQERCIEHAFIGGMGNTAYRFRSPIFRLNIGVLSLYFVRDKRQGDWMVTVRDTTLGKDYCLVHRLRDGAYLFGSRSPASGEDHYWQIEGRYISREHVTLTISGHEITVEDHKTTYGTRIDLLTEEGLARYQQMAQVFLENTDPKHQRDPVRRGRFVLEELLHHHRNFEITFFGAVVDSLLIEGSKEPPKI